jgi:hypothetical protein
MFTAKLTGLDDVVSAICLRTNPPNFTAYDPSSVELQYAASRGGPWRKLGMLPGLGNDNSHCDGVGGWNYYSDQEVPLPGKLLSAYYRVVVPGNGTIEPFTGPVVHSSLNRSRITGFNVSPRSVSSGDRVTVSGLLQKQGKSWSGYAHRKIYIVVWPRRHKKEAGLLFTIKTNGSGRFSRSFTAGTARGKFDFEAEFLGSSKYLWSQSRAVTVSYNRSAAALAHSGLSWWLGSYIQGQRRLGPLPAALYRDLTRQAS